MVVQRTRGCLAGSATGGCSLTRIRPRVSYLRRHSFGIRMGLQAQKVAVPGNGVPEEGCVEQEADGIKVTSGYAGQGLKSGPCVSASVPSTPAAGRSSTGIDWRPGPFPETNFSAGARLQAGCACALTGRGC